MIRNLKVLLGTAMALAALGAFGGSAAQAHTPKQFHCHVEPCEATLEPAATLGEVAAHHVVVVKNGNGETLTVTCDALTGEATSIKTPVEVEFKNIAYDGCKLGTEPTGTTTVKMNGCKYNFAAAGTATITGCEAGKKIEIVPNKPAGCVITVGEQGPLGTISYHNEGTTGLTPATTVIIGEPKVSGIAATLDGACPIPNVAPITGEYTTGKTLVRGYKDGSDHANTANRVDVWWTATVA